MRQFCEIYLTAKMSKPQKIPRTESVDDRRTDKKLVNVDRHKSATSPNKSGAPET